MWWHWKRNLFLYIIGILSNCIVEISVQNLTQLYIIPFMYFILLAWRWPSEVETWCQIKDITCTGCADGIWFLLLLYRKQRGYKRKKKKRLLVLYDQKWSTCLLAIFCRLFSAVSWLYMCNSEARCRLPGCPVRVYKLLTARYWEPTLVTDEWLL